jgi:membrane protease subunit (stomatin/prohibitin family)
MEKLAQAQAELGKAQRSARIANIGIAEAEAKAKQRQFELDQSFQNEARYVQQLAGGDVGTYAASRAMIGAGAGMAKGGDGASGGAMMTGAGLGVGMGMANMFQQGLQARPAAAAPVAAAPAAGGANVACGACNATVPPGKFCQECGASLAPRPKFCPSCGTQGAAGAKFCANCGTSFGT